MGSDTIISTAFLVAFLAALAFAIFHRFFRRLDPPQPTSALREEVARFESDPYAFVPAYRPSIHPAAAAQEMYDLIGDIERTALRGGNEVRAGASGMETARLAAEILSRFGYRAVVLRTPGVVLKVSWDSRRR